MKRSYTRFISSVAVVLAGGVVIALCRAQGQGAAPLALLPDLKIYSVTAPGSASRGASISVSDITTNAGNASAGPSVSDIYICTNVNNVSSSCKVTNHTTVAIGAGRSAQWSGSVTVPSTQPVGTNYYIVVANGNRQVSESNYANNTNYVMIIIN